MFFIIFSILTPWVASPAPLCLKSGLYIIIFQPFVLDSIRNPLLELQVIDQDFILARTKLIEDWHQVLISELLWAIVLEDIIELSRRYTTVAGLVDIFDGQHHEVDQASSTIAI
jgi:hypothetical protein